MFQFIWFLGFKFKELRKTFREPSESPSRKMIEDDSKSCNILMESKLSENKPIDNIFFKDSENDNDTTLTKDDIELNQGHSVVCDHQAGKWLVAVILFRY